MSWCVSIWVYLLWESLGFLDLGGYFISYFRTIIDYDLLKYFLIHFLSLSSYVTHIILVFLCLMFSQRSLTQHSLLFILCLHLYCFSHVHQLLSQLTISSSASVNSIVGSLQCISNQSHSIIQFNSHQFSRSVMSDSLDPMGCSTPGHPFHHQLPEFPQTQIHWVGDAIQPCHPLSSPSPPALNISQH